MGNWYEAPDGKWIYSEDPLSDGANLAVTHVLNAVTYPDPGILSRTGSDVDPESMPPEDQHAHGGDA